MIEFNSTEKQHLVDQHNKLRYELATGNVLGYLSAARMGTMQWDDELTEMIDLNIKRCKYGHDQCRNTSKYPMSGQNLAYVKGYNYGKYNRNAIVQEFDTMTNDWFLQYRDADMNVIRNVHYNGVFYTININYQ